MERIVPRDKWLYNDRGMMKWMGWLLSDHSAFMEGEKNKENLQPILPQMGVVDISDRLQQAWESADYVSIQLNVLNHDNFVPELVGVVVGFDAGRIYLQMDSGETKLLRVEEIRSVIPVREDKWWNDDK
ncbi:DNA-directed RNA polymerase subunit beta [Companilactobacillus sp.]|jgi:hypothetical protein|uniref:DNA-directed RNA polymerase subunit beta n=1 Tax=Companilactobacillus sp. TaxID=2767905 RepID=UPI0025C50CFD|nr:DNA-directed RNA polymerase subunit beta [Companilactobacillus sp.]MCH4007926.1 DNA-directed RNA polymerase subunit beta [Companilactobacillus sp.]MCH4051895.1 DNA-directed RNA polymerase subunit beta [Companilactobacillus sp.]MCH4075869.1 DNA-directed RNA polymerase subunit beta [Companilactobacillus sp.]MCH4124444.1 DNA-directed RNA polymerase subunit beta [Companilactobacillus sp.]MCH4132593.1 DNA-directed RNA polymerase subunit beta [Companilactobacillus sp.]